MNDLIKQNKKFQALSRNLASETKDDNYVDDFEGWGRKKRRPRRLKILINYYFNTH
jgi:hypothetical protein